MVVGSVLLSIGIAAPAQAEDPQPPCINRICLVVVDANQDSDGDGYTDADEKFLGSDPSDPNSHPLPAVAIDLAITGELPSFASHFSELVILPQLTPALDSMATGFGELPLPGKAWLDNSPEDALAQLWSNGFTGIDGLVALSTPSNEPLGGGNWGKYLGLVAAGNPHKTIVSGSYSREYTDTHKDGSQTMTESKGGYSSPGGKVTYATSATSVNEFGADGNLSATKDTTASYNRDPKTGETHSSVTVVTVTYDEKGMPTSNTSQTTKVDIVDGKRTTQVTTKTDDGKGNVTESTSTPIVDDCPDNTCSTKYSDPDVISVGPLTQEDYSRVVARLESIRTPGPDRGEIDMSASLLKPKHDVYALYSGDGVVVLSTQPAVFNRANPEYDPRLSDLAPRAGATFPVTTGGGAGTPDDWP